MDRDSVLKQFVIEAVFALDRNIWRSSITLRTKLRYTPLAFRIHVFCRYSCMVRRLNWSIDLTVSTVYPRSTNRCSLWCFRHILNAHCWDWSDFVVIGLPMMRFILVDLYWITSPVRRRLAVLRFFRFSFFGHLSRAYLWQDHLQACILGPRGDWRRRIVWWTVIHPEISVPATN